MARALKFCHGKRMDQAHHAIDYLELTASDLAATKRFYGAVFGWTFNDYGPGYVGFKDGGTQSEAGGFSLGTPQPGGPLIVLYSSELEATRDAVRAAGGTLTKDIFAFPGGRRFQFLDPSGNELGVWGR
jgi:predicted enzyme related to lactoylglutathione lyase